MSWDEISKEEGDTPEVGRGGKGGQGGEEY